jgi:hypothetical protein
MFFFGVIPVKSMHWSIVFYLLWYKWNFVYWKWVYAKWQIFGLILKLQK